MSFSGVSSRGKQIAAWMTVMIAVVANSPAAVHSQEVTDATAPSGLSQMLHGMNPVNWKLPDLRQVLPGNQEQARIKEKKDGLFSEVGKATANSWNKTKQMFNPQKLNPVRFFPASSRTPTTTREPAKPGFFRSLFFPEPEQKQTQTVNDFLRQSRPNP